MQNPEQLTKLANALGGLPVLGCKPGSPAARAGIRYGDVVLAVNGVPTPDWSAYAHARRQRTGSMQVAVFRAGEELAFELAFDNAPLDLASWLDYLTTDSA